MITTEFSATSAPTTREQRGLALWREHAGAIRFDSHERVWLVPSTSDGGTSVYEVRLGRRESCECRDFGRRGESCKHIFSATVARAKTKNCSGCGGRFPNRETVEVGPELAEASLGYALEGERFCRPCAGRVGVR